MGKKVNNPKNDGFYYLNKTFLFLFLVAGVFCLVFFSKNLSFTIFSFGSLIVSWIIDKLMSSKNIHQKYIFYANCILFLGLVGELGIYYTGNVYYDKLVHVFSGIVLTMIIFDYQNNEKVSSKSLVFFTVLGALCFWEIYEYLVQVYLYFPMMGVIKDGVVIQTPLDDTMIDLIVGAAGSLGFLIFKNNKN